MIVITAPTGNIGRQLLTHLMASGAPLRVIARDPSRLPAPVRARAEVVEGSHSARDVVMRAFEGADSVFWLVPADPAAPSAEAAYVDFARAGCEALRACGVKRVVGVSALGRGWPHPAGHVTATLRMDDAVAATGVAYRALACGSLMENLLRQIVSIREQGVFFGAAPADVAEPAVATRDVAALAARLLLDASWSGVEAIPMMGPQDLAPDEMAAIMAQALGRPVRFQPIRMEDMRAMMTGRGASEGMAQAMVDMLTAKNDGMDRMVPRPVPANSPTGFRTWCDEVLAPAVAGRDPAAR